MPKKYDVVAITGEYEKEGQTKPRYQNVGMVIEKDGKFYLKMNSLVTMHDEGHAINFFSLYTPKNKQQSAPQEAPPAEDPDDSIPF